MRNAIRKIGFGLCTVALAALCVANLFSTQASAADTKSLVCNGVESAGLGGCDTAGTNIDTVWTFAATVVTWILMAVGIICVLFIIIGGIRYATSGGEPEKVKGAKNTVMYAVIGLAIALLATVIVNIVVSVSDQAANTKARDDCKVAGQAWDSSYKNEDGSFGACVRQENTKVACPDGKEWDKDYLVNNKYGGCVDSSKNQ